MDLLTAIQYIEGEEEACSEDECLEAWQWLIDEGHVWKLQGFYGRTAVNLIEAGLCTQAEPKQPDSIR
jgi:hypothetical protein